MTSYTTITSEPLSIGIFWNAAAAVGIEIYVSSRYSKNPYLWNRALPDGIMK